VMLASEESYCSYFNSSGQIAQDAAAACVCAAKLIRSTTLSDIVPSLSSGGRILPASSNNRV
jgi:hypothetical protein